MEYRLSLPIHKTHGRCTDEDKSGRRLVFAVSAIPPPCVGLMRPLRSRGWYKILRMQHKSNRSLANAGHWHGIWTNSSRFSPHRTCILTPGFPPHVGPAVIKVVVTCNYLHNPTSHFTVSFDSLSTNRTRMSYPVLAGGGVAAPLVPLAVEQISNHIQTSVGGKTSCLSIASSASAQSCGFVSRLPIEYS